MVKPNVEVITPAVAEAYLKTNTNKQRPLNKGQVKFYARMMSEGQWQLNGEALVFNKNGELINGQHRCAACIEANVPFETVVVRDVEDNCFYTFDSGYTRSKAQILSIEGIPNASNIASSIQLYMRLQRSKVNSLDGAKRPSSSNGNHNSKLSTEDILMVYRKSPQYWQNLIHIVKPMYRRSRLLVLSEVVALIAYLHKDKWYEFQFVVGFFEQLFYEEATKLPVIRNMRQKLIDNMTIGRMKMSGLLRTQLLIKTWNCYKKSKSISRLSWDPRYEAERVFE